MINTFPLNKLPNNTRTIARNILNWIVSHKIISILLPIVFGTLFQAYAHFYIKAKDEEHNLTTTAINQVVLLAASDDQTNIVCSNPNTTIADIKSVNKIRNSRFEALIATGRLMIEKNYLYSIRFGILKMFTLYNAKLYEAGDTVCTLHAEMMSSTPLREWRNFITGMLAKP